jgi:uncharacterized protein (UPF0332 family)
VATWQEMSLDSLRAAKKLIDEGHWRSAINRSYYAAYCAATRERVSRGIRFAHGRNNPAHHQLPGLMLDNTSPRHSTRRRIARALRILRQAREDADNRPGVTVDRPLALACIHSANDALLLLEVRGD